MHGLIPEPWALSEKHPFVEPVRWKGDCVDDKALRNPIPVSSSHFRVERTTNSECFG